MSGRFYVLSGQNWQKMPLFNRSTRDFDHSRRFSFFYIFLCYNAVNKIDFIQTENLGG